jgi:anti-sigma regulatory factor (Ser/Thr protein kinase)
MRRLALRPRAFRRSSGDAVSDVVTAVSELARNIAKYAGRGRIELSIIARGSRRGLQVVAVDQGPGI